MSEENENTKEGQDGGENETPTTDANENVKPDGNKEDVVEMKDLQAEAIELGMEEEDVKTFRTKASLQIMLKTLRAQQRAMKDPVKAEVVIEEDEKRVITIIEKKNPREEKALEKVWRGKAKAMRDKLEKQTKVSYFIPLTGEEEPGVVREVTVRGRKELVHVSGAIITPQFNGYKMIIPKGVQVLIPQQVFDELNRSRERTYNAGAEYLTSRAGDPEIGGTVADRL